MRQEQLFEMRWLSHLEGRSSGLPGYSQSYLSICQPLRTAFLRCGAIEAPDGITKVAGSIPCDMFVPSCQADSNSRFFGRWEILFYDTYDRYRLCNCIDLSPKH